MRAPTSEKWSQPVKPPRSGPVWQKLLILFFVGSIIFFSIILLLDAESGMAWSGLSNLSTRFEFMVPRPALPVIPDDDPTCLSRTQQTLYRRESKAFPNSESLNEAWKRYGELHKSCTHNKNNWTDVFLTGEGKHDDCNYLIYLEGGAGLGNKILSLTSAFMYALASDRVLLVDSRKTLIGLLCEPFDGSSWLLPNDFPYDLVEKAANLDTAKKANFTHHIANLHLEHLQSSGDQQFFCDSTHYDLMKIRWVGWTSTQYYVTKFFMIPSLYNRLLPLFPSTSPIFTQLSRLLILPNNSTWAHILRVYWAYLSCTGLRVGLQIRLHGRWDLAVFDTAVHNRVMECLHTNDILPATTTQENITQLSNLFSRKMQSQSPSSDIAILVASLQMQYFEQIQQEFSKFPTIDSSIVRVHTVSHGGRQDNSIGQAHDALVEMWLLSFSDAVVTSSYSTFGYVAHGIGGLRPYIMNIRGEKIETDGLPACYGGQSSEPCTHFPMQPDCQDDGVTPEHRTWIDQHVKHCQDQEGGLQLVET